MNSHSMQLGIPVGGFGGGHFVFADSGEFRGWRIHPGLPERDETVAADRFHVWTCHRRRTEALTICPVQNDQFVSVLQTAPHRTTLFPLTAHAIADERLPVRLSNISFSPLIPGSIRESSLPVHIVVWRAENPADDPVEIAFMLTWGCGWPELERDVVFDMQHDNLCITGALGREDSATRVGIAVPDLHSEGIYLLGMEPWDAAAASGDLWEDFAEDGELEPRIVRGESIGVAAWVKFTLEPGEVQEVPFVLAWHFPVYESGPFAGEPRHYTRYLEKFRPDNAIVWLAEEVVQHYGAETANFRYWLQQIRDWHDAVLSDPRFTEAEHRDRINRLASLLHADTAFTADGQFAITPTAHMSREALQSALDDAPPIRDLWPEIAISLESE